MAIDYLWVDSLCIVQDDQQTKKIHLNSMAAIYANAYITFVVAKGEDAGFGVPGVPGGSRARHLPCCTFSTRSGLQFVLSPEVDYWHHQSKWNTRAWTYQEDLFSSRPLLLSDAVTWQCSSHRLQETMKVRMSPWHVAERPHLRVSENPEHSGGQSVDRLGAWARLVLDYNERDLTYDGDVLAAFAGVSEVMRAHFPDGFWHGFPVAEEYQISNLVWRSLLVFRRRVALVAESTINSLPSWSWIGWQGSIHLPSGYGDAANASRTACCSIVTLPNHKNVRLRMCMSRKLADQTVAIER